MFLLDQVADVGYGPGSQTQAHGCFVESGAARCITGEVVASLLTRPGHFTALLRVNSYLSRARSGTKPFERVGGSYHDQDMESPPWVV